MGQISFNDYNGEQNFDKKLRFSGLGNLDTYLKCFFFLFINKIIVQGSTKVM